MLKPRVVARPCSLQAHTHADSSLLQVRATRVENQSTRVKEPTLLCNHVL